MTIEQTIEIPVNHRVFLDLPPDLPVGKARVELTFTPILDELQTNNSGKIHLSKAMINELLQGEPLNSLTGLLHTEINSDEIRIERLKKT